MIYIHIGLPKTATTFVQKKLFPEWSNIKYLGRYNEPGINFPQILRMDKDKKYLLSNEGISGLRFQDDLGKEMTIKGLGELFPDAKIMISFRKHRSLITSFYKQSIRRGETFTFDEFFDIKNNSSVLPRDAVNFRRYIELIEKYFEEKPFIYLQEELNNDLPSLLHDMGVFFGEMPPNVEDLDLNKEFEGLGYYQGQILLSCNKFFSSLHNQKGILSPSKLSYLARDACLFFCLKASFLSKKSIKMTNSKASLVDDYYNKDWNYVLNYMDSECPYRKNFDKSKYL